MQHKKIERLDSGEIFPGMTFDITSGESLILPGEFAGHWGLILFYRGVW